MACVSDSTPPESSQTLGSSWHAASEAPSSSSSKSSVSSLVSSSPSVSSSSSSSSQPRLWSPRFASSPSAPPVPFYFRFSPAERAFLGELTLLNGVIDRILPMLNRNPEPSLLSALCDYTCRLITRSGCSLCQRTFYVFRALYRETSAAETRPYLVRRATAEVLDYIRQHFSAAKWQQKKRNEKEKKKDQSNSSKPNTQDQPPPQQQQQQQQQKQSLDDLLSIVVNVFGLYIDDPLSSAGFGPLTAVLHELGLLRDKHLTSLFVFSPSEARVMRRAVGDGDGDDKEN
ncbi:hypothetical protein TYRP_017520 [Tyrophagus putrescentiae]|nr:hypothetical protein TYRP_017520 [Tyrophagus putrescentiae]